MKISTGCLLALGLGCFGTSMAGSMGDITPQSHFDGFYFGLGTGYSTFFSSIQNQGHNFSNSVFESQVNNQIHSTTASILFDGHVGYGKTLPSHIYLGAKGSVYYTPIQSVVSTQSRIAASSSMTDADAQFSTAVQPIYNIDGVLGYEIAAGLLPFVEAGVSFANEPTRIRGELSVLNAALPSTFDTKALLVSEGYQTEYNIGLGVSYQINPNWFVSGELVYNYLGKYSQSQTFVTGASLTSNETYQLTTLMVSASYLVPWL